MKPYPNAHLYTMKIKKMAKKSALCTLDWCRRTI